MPVVKTRGAELNAELDDGPADKPVLVLSNSLGTSMHMWDPNLTAFRGYFRLLRYDQRGHGGSSAPMGPYSVDDLGNDVLDLLDAFDIPTAFYCGLSLGATIGLWLGQNAPERFERIVGACGVARNPGADAFKDRAARVRESGVSPLIDTLIGRWFTPSFPATHPEAVEPIVDMLEACIPEGYAGCCDALGAVDLRDGLGDITVPTLMIGGGGDPVIPIDAIAAVAAAIPGAGLVVIPNAAHLANVERPSAFSAAVLDHLRGDAYELGMQTRREVRGASYVDDAVRSTSPFDAAFQDYITRSAWGEIWPRPGLDRRSRSVAVLTALIALGHFGELASHTEAALRNGLTAEEIVEVLLQSALYCGLPAARSAFEVAKPILEAAALATP